MTLKQKGDLVTSVVHDMNNKLREHFGQKPSPKSVMPPGACTLKAVRRPIEPEKSWKRWKSYKKKLGWTHGSYSVRKKTHPNLIKNYDALPFEERVKDYTFWAACYAAHRILGNLEDEKS